MPIAAIMIVAPLDSEEQDYMLISLVDQPTFFSYKVKKIATNL